MQKIKPNRFPSSRQEMADAQKTNKPSGKCDYCLMISKTCKKNVPTRGGAPQEDHVFINAEEEFFYEVNARPLNVSREEA